MTAQTGTLYWLPRILADTSLDPTSTLLMVGLADHVNADDECHVGIVKLAEYARCSYGTARRRLAELEARGVLSRSRRRRDDGNLSTYLWHLERQPLARSLRDGPEPEPARVRVRDDQRASGCAMTSARQGARAEPPRGEPPRGEPRDGELILVVADAAPVDRFGEFWSVYPRKVGKPAAEKAWRRAVKRATPEAIIAGAASYAARRAGEDPQFTKHPGPWLNDDRWQDEPAEAEAASGPRLSKSTRSLVGWAARTGQAAIGGAR